MCGCARVYVRMCVYLYMFVRSSWLQGCQGCQIHSNGAFSVRFYATAFNEWAIYVKYTCSHWIPLHIQQTHTHTLAYTLRHTYGDIHMHIKDICRKWVSQTRKQIQGQQAEEEERVCPITIKIYFQLFISATPPIPRLLAAQSAQLWPEAALQSGTWSVLLCIRIHIIITHTPRCTRDFPHRNSAGSYTATLSSHHELCLTVFCLQANMCV